MPCDHFSEANNEKIGQPLLVIANDEQEVAVALTNEEKSCRFRFSWQTRVTHTRISHHIVQAPNPKPYAQSKLLTSLLRGYTMHGIVKRLSASEEWSTIRTSGLSPQVYQNEP